MTISRNWPPRTPPPRAGANGYFEAIMIRAGAMIHGLPMNTYTGDTDLAAGCAFCRKRLPTLNGELQPWRAPNGQFFCNEFCADDSEEVRFRIHGRADRKAHERDFFF